MSTPSLDEILREIEAESAEGSSQYAPARSAGAEVLPDQEASLQPRNSSPVTVPEMDSQIPQLAHDLVGSGEVVSERFGTPAHLSSSQARLPKISAHMVGSLVALLVLSIGFGSAIYLSQQPQDLRQYASEGQNLQVEEEVGAEVELTEQTEMAEESVSPAPRTVWWKQPLVVVGISLLVGGVIFLLVFLHWLFAV